MKEYAITIFVSVLALSSYAWDRSNTHINYFIDTSTTISENLAPTKNIHINDQGNFKLKYDENNKGYTDEAAFKASSPIDVVVKFWRCHKSRGLQSERESQCRCDFSSGQGKPHS